MMKMTIGRTDDVIENASLEDLKAALAEANKHNEDSFVILGKSDQEYRQCLHSNGWILEERRGAYDQHFSAIRREEPPSPTKHNSIFDAILKRSERLEQRHALTDVEQAMLAYLLGKPDPEWLEWVNIGVD
jgi:hypothetical protein